MCHLQVFDHPSVTAIASFISSLPGSAGAAAAAASEGYEEEETDVVAAADLPLARPPAAGMAVQPAASQQLVGISSLACKTAASNAVMRLPGVDASRRVPFNRWDVDRQEQVGRERGKIRSARPNAGVGVMATVQGTNQHLRSFFLFFATFDAPEARPITYSQKTCFCLACSWWAACQCSLVSSWTQWTCLMLLPLA